jgi:hypothetical protein
MVGPTCLSVLSIWIFFMAVRTPVEKPLSKSEVQQIISDRTAASFNIVRAADGSKSLRIALPEVGGRFSIPRAVADDATLKLLDENRVAYTTTDVRTVGSEGVWPLSFLLPVFVVSMGTVMLLRQTGKDCWGTTAPGNHQFHGTTEVPAWQTDAGDSR